MLLCQSVHTLVQDFQLILCSEKNELTMLKISSPVVLPSSVLQKSMCWQMSLVSTYLAKATNCACPLTSTDSSNWSENDSPALSLSSSCSTISVPILSILHETVSFDSVAVLILSAAFFIHHSLSEHSCSRN